MKTPNQTFKGYMYQVNRRKGGLPFVRAPKTCSQAPQLPPSFESPYSLPPKNGNPLTAERLPPYEYGITAEPYFGFSASRQSRYCQKTKNRLPPKNYRRMALPPRLCPPKKALPTITLNEQLIENFLLGISVIIGVLKALVRHHRRYRILQYIAATSGADS